MSKKISVQDKTKPEINPLDLRKMLELMPEEERSKLILEFTPAPEPAVSKRKAEEQEARENLFKAMPKLKAIVDSACVPGGFVIELGNDRKGNFFANTRSIRKKRK